MDQMFSHPAEVFATCIVAIGVLHTFFGKVFEHPAFTHPNDAGIFHLWQRARSQAG